MASFSLPKPGKFKLKASKQKPANSQPKKSNVKSKFVLSIGDDGAILISVVDKKLHKRIFITSPSAPEFSELLSSVPDAPIYVLVDVLDQAYIKSSFPPVSSFNVKKLVKRKLEKDFNKDDITYPLSLGRDNTGRKEWQYLFVSLRNAPPFSSWINAVAEMPNRLAGIYLLPLESQNYLLALEKGFSEKNKKKKVTKSRWKFIVSHNRIGGFRQIVFKDSKVIFTRIAQPIGGLSPDVIAGNIEQETLNLIEYVRRLGYNDSDGLDIFVIASQQVKLALENNSLPAKNLIRLTPFEVNNALGLQNSAEHNDRFGDVIMSTFFASQKKRTLKIHTPYTKKLEILYKAKIALRSLTLMASIVLLGISGYYLLDTHRLNTRISKLKEDRNLHDAKLKEVIRFKGNFGENADKVTDIANLHKSYTGRGNLPFNFIKTFSEIPGFNVKVYNLFIFESIDKKSKKPAITVELKLDFIHPEDSSLEKMLEEVELFTGDVRRKFKEYDIEFSGLPEEADVKLSLNKNNEKNIITNLTIKFIGPKKDKKGSKS